MYFRIFHFYDFHNPCIGFIKAVFCTVLPRNLSAIHSGKFGRFINQSSGGFWQIYQLVLVDFGRFINQSPGGFWQIDQSESWWFLVDLSIRNLVVFGRFINQSPGGFWQIYQSESQWIFGRVLVDTLISLTLGEFNINQSWWILVDLTVSPGGFSTESWWIFVDISI